MRWSNTGCSTIQGVKAALFSKCGHFCFPPTCPFPSVAPLNASTFATHEQRTGVFSKGGQS